MIRLEVMPPVPEDEYFFFTTRFEVIEAVLETLRARLEETGYGGTEFSDDDYSYDVSAERMPELN